MEQVRLGRIESVRYGFGGYQDAMFGFTFELGGKGWGVIDFKGHWSFPPDPRAAWTEAERRDGFADKTLWIIKTMQEAGVRDFASLKGIPIEARFEGNTLKSWRILTEVI